MKLHINDDVYAKLKELATEQNRSVANMAETILLNVWGEQPADPKERKQNPSEEITEPTFRLDATKGTAVPTVIPKSERKVWQKNNVFATPGRVLEQLPKSDRFSGPLCKIHGLPLDSRGKCLQKGCKYA